MRSTAGLWRRGALLLLAATAGFGLPGCKKAPALFVDSPVHGDFLIGTSVTVTGRALRVASYTSFTVNGVPVPSYTAPDWSVVVPLDPAEIFNPIVAELVLPDGRVLKDRLTVIVGDGVSSGFVLDGDASPHAVGLRLGDTGLAQIAPIVESLSGDAIDISGLILSQNPIAQGSMSGISYTANAVGVSMGGFALAADAVPDGLDTTVTVSDLFLEIDLELGILGSCTLEISTDTADITGAYDLAPLAADPSYVDVDLVSGVGVALGGFSSQFVSGSCNDPLIGDIVNLILGQNQIQQLMEDGFAQNLADPDGAGPLDSPLAAAIQDALAGVSIAGPVGAALDAELQAPITAVTEDAAGLTIEADAAITALSPDPEAPVLAASYQVDESFPSLGPTTPVGGLPYGMAFAISSSGMNQLLKAQIENGLLKDDISEFFGQPLTAGLVTLVMLPELADVLLPNAPMVIKIRPSLAPVFTGQPGPGGELAEMKIAGLQVSLSTVTQPWDVVVMEIALDAGVDLAFTQAGLEFALATPAGQDLQVSVAANPLQLSEQRLVNVFQGIFPLFAPELENAIEAFPIPSLLGLELEPVEVSRLPGGYLGLFANLLEIPTTKIENVTVSDASSGDWSSQGGCWLQEWRHRLASQANASSLRANLKAMLGADAGCTTNDAQTVASVDYTLGFDVAAVAGEQWTLAVEHSLLGAFDRISDGYNDGIGFQDGGGAAWFQTGVQGSWRVDGGAWTHFDFDPAPTGLAWDGIGGCSCSEDVEFAGSAQAVVQGTTSAHVELRFQFAMEGSSDSHTAFPTANGDELAIRLGKNDTIDANFTAGSYPGAGSRNIADDGHFVDVQLSVAPSP